MPPECVAGAWWSGGLRSHLLTCSWLLFSSRDDVIGKVCITRDMLAEHPKGRGTGGWGVPMGSHFPPLQQAGPQDPHHHQVTFS